MRVLILKTSSLGDVIHTLPALTDASRHFPGIVFDWVVEEAFAEIPSWHPAVDRVIPVAIRRWRKNLFKGFRSPEWADCKEQLAEHQYDAVIDAQGLLKSAFLTRYVRGPVYGYDKHSIREKWASRAYQYKINVDKQLHAVERIRTLFALSLGYKVPVEVGDYAIDAGLFDSISTERPSVLFLHGTARKEKYWPEASWAALGKILAAEGYQVRLPWGNALEKSRAERIAAGNDQAHVLPRMKLKDLAAQILASQAVVAVDTGLGHLTAALNVPAISLYGPTSTRLIGTYGDNQRHICASHSERPSDLAGVTLDGISPRQVWDVLREDVLLLKPPADV